MKHIIESGSASGNTLHVEIGGNEWGENLVVTTTTPPPVRVGDHVEREPIITTVSFTLHSDTARALSFALRELAKEQEKRK